MVPNVPLHLIRVILIRYEPVRKALQQLSFLDVGCFWDLLWLVRYILYIVFIETEATALLFMAFPSSMGLASYLLS